MIENSILIFVISLAALFFAGPHVMHGLMGIARYLRWQEFIVAFILVAFAGTLPNLSVGISSALHGIPELSFGDVLGGNIVDLTLAIALAALIAGGLPTKSPLIRQSALITALIALLPIALLADGTLGRVDGLVLIAVFLLYVRWLFAKKERFQRQYKDGEQPPVVAFREFMKNLGQVAVGLVLLLAGAEGVVRSTMGIADFFGFPLYLMGILVIAIGNALPETYFAIISARSHHRDMVLGNLMGSVIVPSTLVLGIVTVIHPIVIDSLTPFAIARVVLVAAAFFFFFFVRTGRVISRQEGLFLVLLYLIFIAAEIFTQTNTGSILLG